MADQSHAMSASLHVPKACIERQTRKGPVFVPLVPVDQLPYRIQGIPLHINHRQVIKESWQLLDETTEESPTALQILSSSPEPPKHRAPDHNVVNAGANQAFRKDTAPDGQPAARTPTRVWSAVVASEQNHRTNGAHNINNPIHLIQSDESLPKDTKRTKMIDSKHLDHSDIPITSTAISNGDSDSLRSYHSGGNHHVRQEVDQTHVPSAAAKMIIDTRSDSIVASHASSSDVENEHITRNHYNDRKAIVIGSRSNLKNSERPKKIYCTHWIKCGECLWGEGCKYKHEMPESLFHLREVTQGGLRSYPQWWKDQTAIKARSPTWLETQLRGQKDKTSIREDEPKSMASLQVPDPSTWRNIRQQNGSVVDQEHRKSVVSVGGSSTSSHTARDTAAVPHVSPISEKPEAITATSSSIIPTQKKSFSPIILRRLSQISLSSDGSEGTSTVKKRFDVNTHPKTTRQNLVSRIKRSGLAASIYAPREKDNHVGHDSRSYRDTKSHSEPELLTGFEEPFFERLAVQQDNLLSN